MPIEHQLQWQAGWIAQARRVNSPNFGPRPPQANIDLLVLHSISLPPGEYGNGAVEQLFTNCLDWDAHPYFQSIRGIEVSSHFFITRQGELVQFVSTCERAWHAGASEWRGRPQCNDDSIGIELEGLEGLEFEEAQYHTLIQLCRTLRQAHPLRHIAGHEHIAPGRKLDPGPGFAWHRLHDALNLDDWCFPQTTLSSGSTS
jgi:AmpD protein